MYDVETVTLIVSTLDNIAYSLHWSTTKVKVEGGKKKKQFGILLLSVGIIY